MGSNREKSNIAIGNGNLNNNDIIPLNEVRPADITLSLVRFTNSDVNPR